MNPSPSGVWLQPGHVLLDTDSSVPPNSRSSSLGDVAVVDLVEQYKHDPDLLKHILAAKTEEDKRRAAEEIRRVEEARLQSKYLDLLERERRAVDPSTLIDSFGSLVMSPTNDASSEWIASNMSLTTSMVSSPLPFGNTPPSPTMSAFLAPPSPYTSLDTTFEHTMSVASSPEPTAAARAPRQGSIDALSVPSPVPQSPTPSTPDRSCKRTLSRTRSQRKTGQSTKHSKRNRQVAQSSTEQDKSQGSSSQSSSKQDAPKASSKETKQKQNEESKEDQLDHDMVMEALRRKLLRQPHEKQTLEQQMTAEAEAQMANMSPSGILLLDLKNPRKSFSPRKPHVASRRARPFASAHNYCEKIKDGSTKDEKSPEA